MMRAETLKSEMSIEMQKEEKRLRDVEILKVFRNNLEIEKREYFFMDRLNPEAVKQLKLEGYNWFSNVKIENNWFPQALIFTKTATKYSNFLSDELVEKLNAKGYDIIYPSQEQQELLRKQSNKKHKKIWKR